MLPDSCQRDETHPPSGATPVDAPVSLSSDQPVVSNDSEVRARSPMLTGIRIQTQTSRSNSNKPDHSTSNRSGLVNGTACSPVSSSTKKTVTLGSKFSSGRSSSPSASDQRPKLEDGASTAKRAVFLNGSTVNAKVLSSVSQARGLPGRVEVSPKMQHSNITNEVFPLRSSPLSKRVASEIITGVVARHQERENSCTPSPSPLTPSPSPHSTECKIFSFTTDSTRSSKSSPSTTVTATIAESSAPVTSNVPEVALPVTTTAGRSLATPEMGVTTDDGTVLLATATMTLGEDSSVYSRKLNHANSLNTVPSDRSATCLTMERHEHVEDNSNVEKSSLDDELNACGDGTLLDDDFTGGTLLEHCSSSSSPRPLHSPLLPAVVSALRQDEPDSGRLSRMSDASSSSFEYESFQTGYKQFPSTDAPHDCESQAPPTDTTITCGAQSPLAAQALSTDSQPAIVCDILIPSPDLSSCQGHLPSSLLDLAASSSCPELGATPHVASSLHAEANTNSLSVASQSSAVDSVKLSPSSIDNSVSTPTLPSTSSSATPAASGYRPLSSVPGVPIVTRLGGPIVKSNSLQKQGRRIKRDVGKQTAKSDTNSKQTAKAYGGQLKAKRSQGLQKWSQSAQNVSEVTSRPQLSVSSQDVSHVLSETSLPPSSSKPAAGIPSLTRSAPRSSTKSLQRLNSGSLHSGASSGSVDASLHDFHAGMEFTDLHPGGGGGVGFNQVSMPNLSDPSFGSTTSLGTTVNSMGDTKTGSLRRKATKQTPSPLKRFSISMMNLVGIGSGKGTKTTSWHFSSGQVSASETTSLSSRPSSALEVLGSEECNTISYGVEVAPDAINLDNWLNREESSVLKVSESGISPGQSDSDDEYHTASENESSSDYVHSSVSILTKPCDITTRQAGYTTKVHTDFPTTATTPDCQNQAEVVMHNESLTPSAPKMSSSKVSVSTKEAVKSDGASATKTKKTEKSSRKLAVLVRKKDNSNTKASKRVTAPVASPAAVPKRRELPTSTPGKKGMAKDPIFRGESPKSSPKTIRKTSPNVTPPLGSPKVARKRSPTATPPLGSPASVRKMPHSAISPRSSPGVSRSGSSTSRSSLESPLSGKLSPLATNSSRSPNSSFRTSTMKSSPSSSRKQKQTTRSPNSSSHLSTTNASIGSQSITNKKQSSSTAHSGHQTSSASPTAAAKVSRNSDIKAKPQEWHNVEEAIVEEEEDSSLQSTNSGSSFSRFSRDRKPVRKTSVSVEHASERVDYHRQRSKDEKVGALKKISLSRRPERFLPPLESPTRKPRSNSIPNLQTTKPLTPTPAIHLSPTSPHLTPPSPQTPERRRRLGLSLHSTPGIDVMESPIRTPLSSSSETTPRKLSVQLPTASATNTATSAPLDIDSLQQKLGKLQDVTIQSASDATGFMARTSDQNTAGAAAIFDFLSSDSYSSTTLATVGASSDLGEENRPDIATMPASIFSVGSPSHSAQSSFDFDVEEMRSPSNLLSTSVTSGNVPGSTAPLSSRWPKGNTTSSLHHAKKVAFQPDDDGISPGTSTLDITPAEAKGSVSTGKFPAKQRVNAMQQVDLASSRQKDAAAISSVSSVLKPSKGTRSMSSLASEVDGEGELQLAHAATSSAHQNTQSKGSHQHALSSQSKSDSKLVGRNPTKQFTSSRPPKPPTVNRLRLSDAGTLTVRETPPCSPALPSETVTQDKTRTPVAGVTSATGMKRPVGSASAQQERRSTTAGLSPSATTGSVAAGPRRASAAESKLGSSMRAKGKKVSAAAKGKEPASGSTTFRKTPSVDETASRKSSSALGVQPSARRSMKVRSSVARPQSAVTAQRKGSTPHGTLTRDSHASGRRSMRRSSSGDLMKNKPIRPGSSATLRRERRPSQASSNLSMRSVKSGTTMRPHSASVISARNSVATRSMRLPRLSSAGRKSISSGTSTLPRGLGLTRHATPPSSSEAGLHASPTRKSLKRSSIKGDVFAVFDQISAEAKGQM